MPVTNKILLRKHMESVSQNSLRQRFSEFTQLFMTYNQSLFFGNENTRGKKIHLVGDKHVL